MIGTKKTRILVVDDEPELMAALCETLNEKGYEVLGFSSCADALKALSDEDFDLLLLDLMMPETDGIEFLKEAQKTDPNVVGIIMTGHGTVHTAVEAMKVGAFDYVLKPFKMNMLLAVLCRALEMRRLRNENLQLRESMAIYDLATTIAFTLDIDVILNKIADAVLTQCEADELSIMLLTGAEDELYVAIVRGGHNEGILGKRIPIRKGIAGWVASNRKELLLEGEVCDPRFAPVKPRPEIKSSLSMPLLVGGKCIGVLNVNSKKRKSFLFEKVKALKILAGNAASALENARLYRELQKAEHQYRSILENASEGIFQVAPDGRYHFVNPSMARILGYEKPEEVIASDTKYECLLADQEERQGMERQILRRDGAAIWVSENVRAVRDDQGRLRYFEGTMEDITKRKEAEEVLRENKQLEIEMARLDRLHLVGEMAAGIGHEIRNPMTTVRGYLQMFQKKDEFARYHDQFATMIEELDRANAIITDFLSLAKDKAIEMKRGNLNKVILSLAPLLQADAFRLGHNIRIESDDIPDNDFDEKKIRQLILNLVRNSFEAMEASGEVIIRTYRESDSIVLAVQDTGPGIPMEVLEKLGTPFVTTKDGGTGLGLPVCYRIANRHGAKIDVHTGPAGTNFSIIFNPPSPLRHPIFYGNKRG